jgi:hypothetical protein
MSCILSISKTKRKVVLSLFEESEQLNLEISTIFKVTNDIETEIVDVANHGDYDLLLVGLGKSILKVRCLVE